MSFVQSSPRTIDDRALGALLGMAVGDAFGTTQEFGTPEAPPFPALATGPQRELVGGGPFGLEAGQVTDDTQMAVALWTSVLACGGLDPEDVGARYVDWVQASFDRGNQTSAALGAIESGTAAVEAGVAVWERSGRRAAGNGSLMRTAVLAVLFEGDALREAALLDSAITHADPRCLLACAAFDAAVARAMDPSATRDQVVAAARAELSASGAAAARLLSNAADELAEAQRLLAADLDLASADDPQLYTDETHLHRHSGYVRVAFRLAFWHLVHAPSFTDAIVDVTNRGGDADTNAAITGALLGAFHGAGSIPAAWRELVLAAPGVAGPRFGPVHPRAFVG